MNKNAEFIDKSVSILDKNTTRMNKLFIKINNSVVFYIKNNTLAYKIRRKSFKIIF